MVVGASTSPPVRRVRRTLDDAGASLTGRRVLALCSGGADSVALVVLLGQLPTGAAPRRIDVMWCDHRLRVELDADRAAAEAAARSIGASFHVVAAPVEHEPGTSLEAAARDLRYQAAIELAATLDCDVVCTGHSASDQVEQALMSLIGVTGRGGTVDAMPVSRDLAPGVELVRPLLGCTRERLEQACLEAGLAWAVDPTNLDPDYAARNAVRHRVIPALLDVRADAGIAIARAGRQQRDLVDVTRGLAARLLDAWAPDDVDRLDMRRIADLDPATRRELIAAWLRRAGLGRAVSERAVVAVDQLAIQPARSNCSRVDLSGTACVRRDGYDLSIVHAPRHGGSRP